MPLALLVAASYGTDCSLVAASFRAEKYLNNGGGQSLVESY
jgi:hypothetical protein